MTEEPWQKPLDEAVNRGRLESTRYINRARLVAMGFLLGYYAVAVVFLEATTDYLASVSVAVTYAAMAAIIWWMGRQGGLKGRFTRLAIPLVDMPMLFLIQAVNLRHSEHPEAVAAFSTALFVFLTVLASLAMVSQLVWVSTAAAVVCQFILERMAGGSATAILADSLVIIMAGILCSYLPKRQIHIITEAAEKQKRRDLLARYFSPNVAEAIESRASLSEDQSCQITVLFLDIRGFTSLIESMESPRVVRMLNEFFGHMVEVIFHYGGTLDKYLGDGLMAYFNAPVAHPDHAVHAVRAALEMRRQLDSLNERRIRDGAPELSIGIGIHTGTAVVGSIGAPNRREYTVIGDTVNVAARLEALTKEHEPEILVSEVTAEKILNLIDFEEIGEVSVRGRKRKIKVLAPVRERDSALAPDADAS